MNAKMFRGTGVALVTPFKKDKSVDYQALEKLVDHVIQHGVNYLVVLGTTGEPPTLSQEEKRDILACVIAKNNKRVPLVCGIGGNNTQAVIAQLTSYPVEHVDAILSVSPYYSKPTQAGIIAHFKELDKHTPRPIILYNVPGRTGSNMLASTTIHIANECKNMIAVKEASGNMVQCMELVQHKPDNFLVLSGDDNLALAQIACGFDGVISVAANCFTQKFCDLIQASLRNDFITARQLQYQLLDGIDLLFAEGNPSGAKFVLSEMGICANEFRLPIVPVSNNTELAIKAYLKAF